MILSDVVKPFFVYKSFVICFLIKICDTVIHHPDLQANETYILGEISNGKIRGKVVTTPTGNKANAFFNIPYASPPVGNLRFRPSIPPENWEGVRDCTKFGPFCAPSLFDRNATGSRTIPQEDCLYLNVFSGQSCSASAPCPVLYWVLGGAYYYGQPTDPKLDKLIDNFASKGIVWITSSFRLGTMSFWSTNESDATGNNVLYDILQGLKWVQKNIAMLGGDPKQVTIMGHSSGSSQIGALSLSRQSRGLFHQAIFMAGAPKFANCTELSREVAVRVKCATNEEWNAGRAFRNITNCMRNISFRKILDTEIQMLAEDRKCGGIAYDGPHGLFPVPADQLREERPQFNLLTGNSMYEYANLEYLELPDDSDETVIRTCEKYAKGRFKNYQAISNQCPVYFNSKYTNKSVELKELLDSYWFTGTYIEAAAQRDKGSSVYIYSFDYVIPGLEGIVPFHAFELIWVLGFIDQKVVGFTEREYKVTKYFVPLFENFIKYGDPTPDLTTATKIPEFHKLQGPIGFNYYSVNLPKPENKPYFHLPLIEFWLSVAPALEFTLNGVNDQQPTNLNVNSRQTYTNLKKPGPKGTLNWQTAFFVILGVAGVLLITLTIMIIGTRKAVKKRKRNMYIGLDIDSPKDDYVTFEKSTLIDAAEYQPEVKERKKYWK